MSSTELEQLARDFTAAHPRDAARLLARLSPEDAAAFFDACPAPLAAGAARFLTAEELVGVAVHLSPERVAALFENLPRDQVATSLRRLGEAERRRVVELLPDDLERSLKAFLRYGEGSAGALMDPAVLTVLAGLTAAEALESVHRHLDRLRYYVYVVDDSERLVGVLTLRELMTADPETPVESVMSGRVQRISARATAEAILRHDGWREVPMLPVVDESNTLVGILPYESLRRLDQGEAPESPEGTPMAALGELFWAGPQLVLGELVSILRKGTP